VNALPEARRAVRRDFDDPWQSVPLWQKFALANWGRIIKEYDLGN